MTTTSWTLLHPKATIEHLGLIPAFLSLSDPAPAKEQFDRNYAHGGGWNPMSGWRFSPNSRTITYPGDSPYAPIASLRFRNETIYLYQHAWVCIVQEDGSFEVSRMD